MIKYKPFSDLVAAIQADTKEQRIDKIISGLLGAVMPPIPPINKCNKRGANKYFAETSKISKRDVSLTRKKLKELLS